MDCLRCHQPMLIVTESHFFRHLTYDVCDRCGGLWLDRGELDKLALRTPGSVEESTLEIYREERNGGGQPYQPFPPPCPRCHAASMLKMHFMGEARILMDYCEQCGGLWVEGGQLTKINQHIRWFDKKARPSPFGRFLRHAHSTFFHRIDVEHSIEREQPGRRVSG